MTKFRLSALAAIVLLATSVAAVAAGLFPGLPIVGATGGEAQVTGNGVVPYDSNLPNGVAPQSGLMTVTQLLQGNIVTANNATSFTATAAQTVGAARMILVLSGAPSAAQNITTPTATALIAALPAGSAVPNYSWLLKIVNQGGTSSGVWTVVGGTGVTITGNATVAVANSRQLQCLVTAATTVTCQDLGT